MGKKKEIDVIAEAQPAATTLLDFVVPQKVDAFCKTYAPCDYEGETTETFTDSRLREFFKAWPCSLGDPLTEYVSLLCERGFVMQVSLDGEPAIFARLRTEVGGL